MTACVTFNSRAVRRAAPKEARGPLGGREPYSADGGRQ
jgi:hypothetical protein